MFFRLLRHWDDHFTSLVNTTMWQYWSRRNNNYSCLARLLFVQTIIPKVLLTSLLLTIRMKNLG